jgi:hypothetical protein
MQESTKFLKMILLLYWHFSQQELTKELPLGVNITKKVSNTMYLGLNNFQDPKLSENMLLTRFLLKHLILQ